MTEIVVKKLRCSKCGGGGYRWQYELFDGTVRVVIKCSNCGHEKVEHEYKKQTTSVYLMTESDDFEIF